MATNRTKKNWSKYLLHRNTGILVQKCGITGILVQKLYMKSKKEQNVRLQYCPTAGDEVEDSNSPPSPQQCTPHMSCSMRRWACIIPTVLPRCFFGSSPIATTLIRMASSSDSGVHHLFEQVRLVALPQVRRCSREQMLSTRMRW